MKGLRIFLLSLSFLFAANDNPFAPPQELSKELYEDQFERKEVIFNSDARILKKINITYITLDGSEKSIDLDINESIDWHDTYAFVRAKSPQATPMLDAPITTPEQFSLLTEESTTLDVEIPSDNGKLEDFISFASYKTKIKLLTQDEMIGNFVVGNPSKIVLDFKNSANFISKNLRLKMGSPFNRLALGSHKGYYRLVVYLDGKYNYNIEKDASGYIVNLR
ncbi:AMIN domain-containing protein [Campylobacter troglodytis]|uniref:AMIN domain-containing protein n=1 Tax=Campylobacter troglodytis TaxID=654363 RepID=UPI00115AB68D|nr:AMIN domain-containing protein [Campylobacter troglodytis]TQR59056.1 AMIN domain-containing protein [Campylobacter troglodytis]